MINKQSDRSIDRPTISADKMNAESGQDLVDDDGGDGGGAIRLIESLAN